MAISARRVVLMLWALSLGSFLTTSSGTTRSPFLLDMAHDLNTDLTSIGNLMAITAVTWGIMSLVAGALSDRIGRKPILVGAIVTVGVAMVGIGVADSYAAAVLWGGDQACTDPEYAIRWLCQRIADSTEFATY